MHEAGARLGDFLLGYVLVLATPGPNLLVIAGVAALRGLRGALPLCLGVALGAGTLNAVVAATLGALAGAGAAPWLEAGHWIGAGLLLWVAVSVARSRPPDPAVVQRRATHGAEFGAGFCTALTNPMTAAYFAAQFLGPLAATGKLRLLVPISVTTTAMVFFLGVAALLSHPACRGAALAWHRPIRLAASIMLVLMATSLAHAALQ